MGSSFFVPHPANDRDEKASAITKSKATTFLVFPIDTSPPFYS
jgi:hypothetical protein